MCSFCRLLPEPFRLAEKVCWNHSFLRNYIFKIHNFNFSPNIEELLKFWLFEQRFLLIKKVLFVAYLNITWERLNSLIVNNSVSSFIDWSNIALSKLCTGTIGPKFYDKSSKAAHGVVKYIAMVHRLSEK